MNEIMRQCFPSSRAREREREREEEKSPHIVIRLQKYYIFVLPIIMNVLYLNGLNGIQTSFWWGGGSGNACVWVTFYTGVGNG
jgi:hypothetical protein